MRHSSASRLRVCLAHLVRILAILAVVSVARPAAAGTLKVLTWNIHHGVGTDGCCDIDRLASWIAQTGADVVSLNEVERFTGWGNEDQPAKFASLLRQKTGRAWHYHFAQREGRATGQGNLWLSVLPLDATATRTLSYQRAVAQIGVTVDGRRIDLFSVHLDDDSSSQRATQMGELTR